MSVRFRKPCAMSWRSLGVAALLALAATTPAGAQPLHPKPQPLHPKPQALHPKPQALPVQPPAPPGGPTAAATPDATPASAAPDPFGTGGLPDGGPGLVNEIGKLFADPPRLFPPLKSPAEAIEDFNARSKNAAESFTHRLTTSSMVTGRIKCPVADNGAPDCEAAAVKLCQTKGFKDGKSNDTEASQVCSMNVLLTGKRQPGDCRTDNFVTRALCQ